MRWVPPGALSSHSSRRIRIGGGETRRGSLLGSRGEETAQKHGAHCSRLGPTIWVSRGRDLTGPSGRSGGRREDLGEVSDKSWVALVFCLNTPSQAAMGIAHLLVMALEKEGVPKADATRKIWMVDSKGLIVKVLSVWRPAGFLTPTTIGRGLEEIFQGAHRSDRIESRRTAVSWSPQQMTQPPVALTTLVQSFDCECKWICVLLPASSPHFLSGYIEPQLTQVTCSLSSPSLHILFFCLQWMPISFPACPCGNMRVSAKNRGVPHKQQQTLSGQTPTGGDRGLDPASGPRHGCRLPGSPLAHRSSSLCSVELAPPPRSLRAAILTPVLTRPIDPAESSLTLLSPTASCVKQWKESNIMWSKSNGGRQISHKITPVWNLIF